MADYGHIIHSGPRSQEIADRSRISLAIILDGDVICGVANHHNHMLFGRDNAQVRIGCRSVVDGISPVNRPDHPNINRSAGSDFRAQVIPAQWAVRIGRDSVAAQQLGDRLGVYSIIVRRNLSPQPVDITDKSFIGVIGFRSMVEELHLADMVPEKCRIIHCNARFTVQRQALRMGGNAIYSGGAGNGRRIYDRIWYVAERYSNAPAFQGAGIVFTQVSHAQSPIPVGWLASQGGESLVRPEDSAKRVRRAVIALVLGGKRDLIIQDRAHVIPAAAIAVIGKLRPVEEGYRVTGVLVGQINCQVAYPGMGDIQAYVDIVNRSQVGEVQTVCSTIRIVIGYGNRPAAAAEHRICWANYQRKKDCLRRLRCQHRQVGDRGRCWLGQSGRGGSRLRRGAWLDGVARQSGCRGQRCYRGQ